MAAARQAAALADDGEHDSAARWRAADCRWNFPMDAAEERLPRALSFAAEFSDDRLARGKAWRVAHGIETWRVLHGLLLVSHGAALRGRRDERVVDRHHLRAPARRESRAARFGARKSCRRPARGLGSVADFSPTELTSFVTPTLDETDH